VICFAAFQAQRDLGDLITLFVVGLLGILPKRFGWPRPALLIGFVLADQSETYLYQSVQFYDWDFLLRPGVLIIAAITVVSAWVGARKAPTGEIDAEAAVALKANNMRPQAWFATAVFAFFAWGLIDGLGHSFIGGIYPIGIGVTMLPIAGYLVYMTWSNKIAHSVNYDHEVEGDHLQGDDIPGLWHYILWLASFLISTVLIGFWLSIVGFFVIFLRVNSEASWIRIAAVTTGGVGFVTALAWIMVLDFPRGLLQDVFELPWPIG
jgi:hypothetical protein